jgi:hypothetical protein
MLASSPSSRVDLFVSGFSSSETQRLTLARVVNLTEAKSHPIIVLQKGAFRATHLAFVITEIGSSLNFEFRPLSVFSALWNAILWSNTCF